MNKTGKIFVDKVYKNRVLLVLKDSLRMDQLCIVLNLSQGGKLEGAFLYYGYYREVL